MADYYTHFSCVLDLGTADAVARALTLYTDTPANDDGLSFADGFALQADPSHDTAVWMHDDDRGDVEQVIRFVLLCAETFDLTGLWGFDYANSCTRPLLDAFGGGAHVVDFGTRTSHAWVNTTDWLTRVLAGDDPDA